MIASVYVTCLVRSVEWPITTTHTNAAAYRAGAIINCCGGDRAFLHWLVLSKYLAKSTLLSRGCQFVRSRVLGNCVILTVESLGGALAPVIAVSLRGISEREHRFHASLKPHSDLGSAAVNEQFDTRDETRV